MKAYCSWCGWPAGRLFQGKCADCATDEDRAPLCDRCNDRVPEVSTVPLADGTGSWQLCAECAALPSDLREEG